MWGQSTHPIPSSAMRAGVSTYAGAHLDGPADALGALGRRRAHVGELCREAAQVVGDRQREGLLLRGRGLGRRARGDGSRRRRPQVESTRWRRSVGRATLAWQAARRLVSRGGGRAGGARRREVGVDAPCGGETTAAAAAAPRGTGRRPAERARDANAAAVPATAGGRDGGVDRGAHAPSHAASGVPGPPCAAVRRRPHGPPHGGGAAGAGREAADAAPRPLAQQAEPRSRRGLRVAACAAPRPRRRVWVGCRRAWRLREGGGGPAADSLRLRGEERWDERAASPHVLRERREGPAAAAAPPSRRGGGVDGRGVGWQWRRRHGGGRCPVARAAHRQAARRSSPAVMSAATAAATAGPDRGLRQRVFPGILEPLLGVPGRAACAVVPRAAAAAAGAPCGARTWGGPRSGRRRRRRSNGPIGRWRAGRTLGRQSAGPSSCRSTGPSCRRGAGPSGRSWVGPSRRRGAGPSRRRRTGPSSWRRPGIIRWRCYGRGAPAHLCYPCTWHLRRLRHKPWSPSMRAPRPREHNPDSPERVCFSH